MSVPLQSVPEDQQNDTESLEESEVTQAKHEAAEIVARARRQAEAIVAEARTAKPDASSPLAALGDNAEEIIGQVRKLIKKQRQLQTERQELLGERDQLVEQVAALAAERDELVQRLTDAVVRMEELDSLASQNQTVAPPAPPPPPAASIPHQDEGRFDDKPAKSAPIEEDLRAPGPETEQQPEDTSLAARLGKVEQEDTSLAARLRQAEQEESAAAEAEAHPGLIQATIEDDDVPYFGGDSDRSFYSRHSAKLPRLEGDGGRSVLSAVGGMRPETEPKGRKGRRRKKEK